ncbi:hypothetical protein M8J77_008043 [Diaphorina citri]|nr:hypothetical protein M8J77_006328 [Diaphorina citri]KAI5717571.1 hypothetical protein M8J77_008043 [Diaphorina citri]
MPRPVSCEKYATKGPNNKSLLNKKYHQKNKDVLTIGTWNVRGLNNLGKVDNVIKEMNSMNIDILGMSETFLRGTNDYNTTLTSTDERYRIITSGGEKSRRGVGVILNQKCSKLVSSVINVSDRVIAVRIESSPINMFIIQCYAPTSDCSETELEDFYQQLRETIKHKKSRDALFVLGDFNSKVGKSRYKNIVGPYGLGVKNNHGENLISFCEEFQLFLCNTWFEQKESARYTWTSPDKTVKNQIDFICASWRFRNGIINTKTRPGADCGSDHNPVVMKVKIKLKKPNKKKPNMKWDLDKAKNPNIKELFAITLNQEIDKNCSQSEMGNANTRWNNLKISIKATAEKIIGKSKMLAKQKWMTNEILDWMEKRKQFKNSPDPNERAKYRDTHKHIQKLCRKAREDWINKECAEAEILERKNSNKFHQKVKSLAFKDNKTSHSLINANGDEIFDSNDILTRWTEYCSELYDDEERPNVEEQENLPNHEIPTFTTEDIKKIIQNMSNHKSSGCDEIPAELLKIINDNGIEQITNLINEIYRSGIIPEDFLTAIFIPLPKKNKAKHCSDFRTISLISHTSKILITLIKIRINDIIESHLSESQLGFRRGKGCRDGLSGLRIILERSIEMKKDIYLAFIDFQKAFDNIKHTLLMQILKDIQLPKAEVRLIETLYWGQKGKVRTKDGISNTFNVKKGVRQGCIISPILFNIFVEKIIAESIEKEERGLKINGEVINNLRYADDTLLLATSKSDLKYLMSKLFQTCEQYGMKINMKKTKVMCVSKNEEISNEDCNIIINGEKLEQVKKYKYLGADITTDARCNAEIIRRAGIAKSAFWNHKELMRSTINIKTKTRLLKTYIFSIFTYGCESWTISESMERRINALEMWFYRRMLKISWRDKVTNIDVLRRMKKKNCELLRIIKQRKVSYAGHILRGSNGKLPTKIIEGKIDGVRARGRQRRTWMDDVKEWTGLVTYEEVKRMAENREEWKHKVEEIQQPSE